MERPFASSSLAPPLSIEEVVLHKDFVLNLEEHVEDLTKRAWLYNFLTVISTVAFCVIATAVFFSCLSAAPLLSPFVLVGFSGLFVLFKQCIYNPLIERAERTSQQSSLYTQAQVIAEEWSGTVPMEYPKKEELSTSDALPLAALCKAYEQDHEKTGNLDSKVRAAWYRYLLKNPFHAKEDMPKLKFDGNLGTVPAFVHCSFPKPNSMVSLRDVVTTTTASDLQEKIFPYASSWDD